MSDSVEMKALKWALGRNTGSSSKAMCAELMGVEGADRSYPRDAGDLGRCIGMLKAVPELRQHLDRMRTVSPYWKALVENWTELEALYVRDDRKLYDRMQEILRPIERGDRNIVHLGDGLSIRFGK